MPWVKSDRDEVLKEYPNLKEFLPYLDELNRESPRGKVLISPATWSRCSRTSSVRS